MTTHEPVSIAVIGGSGLYQFPGVELLEERQIDTPFGPTSDAILITRVGDRRVAFLPRHGRGHRHNPTRVPYKANIWALKKLGVFWCISVSAVGSLKQEMAPEHFVVPDQIIDRTRSRENTLFDEIAVHAGFSKPFNPGLRSILFDACKKYGQVTAHDGGTYVCMEGPLFSTQAESAMHRSWGASLIGMTALPEAKFAREAEMAYATLALVTDYDVWHEDDHVDVSQVMVHMRNNITHAQPVLKHAIASIPLGQEAENDASRALENAIMTAPHLIPDTTWDAWGDLLLHKYIERHTTDA